MPGESSFSYNTSKLYLNYGVAEQISKMIRETRKSFHFVGYRFSPHSDEGRDIFLALHELGLRCKRENRDVEIVIAINSREGLINSLYPSNTKGLEWIQSFTQLYPNLKIKAVKVAPIRRDSLHSKAAVADNLVMLRSGDISKLNGRHNKQREDGILIASSQLASQVREIIKHDAERRNAIQIEAPLLSTLASESQAPPLVITEKTVPFNFKHFALLKKFLDSLKQINSSIVNPTVNYDTVKQQFDFAQQTINSLKEQQDTQELLQLFCHDYQEALLARIQWLTTLILIEQQAFSLSDIEMADIKSQWERKEYNPEIIAARFNISEERVKSGFIQLNLKTLQENLQTIHNTLKEAGTSENNILEESNDYASLCVTLKDFVQKLPHYGDLHQMPALERAKNLLKFEIIWKKLFFAFSQQMQSCEDNFTFDENSLLSRDFDNNEYLTLFSFLELFGQEISNFYQQQEKQWGDELVVFNTRRNESLKQGTLLHQQASVSPATQPSAYKAAFIKNIEGLKENDAVNICVTNLNDVDIIASLKRACNRGVIVRIAIAKYRNAAWEYWAGGNNTIAIQKLLNSIEQDKRKNLQVRWSVFKSAKNENWLGDDQGISYTCSGTGESSHRKYVSMHKLDSEQSSYVAFIGSSPLDQQANFHSAELDVLLSDEKEIAQMDRDLFEPEYNAGIELHFCLAIQALKKAGFTYYAQYQYDRYIKTIDTTGKAENNKQRFTIYNELVTFVRDRQPLLTKVNIHLCNLTLPSHSDLIELTPIEAYLQKLVCALDQYKKGKNYSAKSKYLSLFQELKNAASVEEIQETVTQRLKEQTGYLRGNSFAVCLARNDFFPTISSKGKTADIISSLNGEILKKPTPRIFSNCCSSLFSCRYSRTQTTAGYSNIPHNIT